jgi:hypothetical protein
MITARFISYEEAKVIILDEEMYDRVTDDYCPAREDFEMPYIENIKYIGGYLDKDIASLFVVYDNRMHFMVLKQYRKYARELYKVSSVLYPYSVYVKIPSKYKEVIAFSKKVGFKEIAIEKAAFKKNNIMYDLYTLVNFMEGKCQL